MTILLFLAILTILVFVHELGHFLLAKWAKVRVDEFAIGFPPRIFGVRRGETLYSFNLLPLGGYVKIFGENPEDRPESEEEKKRNFMHQPRLVQSLILIGGVAFNLIFAWFLFVLALTFGLTVPVESSNRFPLEDTRVEVVAVLPHSPAALAGLRPQDRVVSLEASGAKLVEPGVREVQEFIAAHSSGEITFQVDRKSDVSTELSGMSRQEFTLTPVEGVVARKLAVGVSLAELGTLKLSPKRAIPEGLRLTGQTAYSVGRGFLDFLKKALSGRASVAELTGPVGIAGMVGNASEFGLTYLLGFAAFISINLAVINVLPFPALDGGRLLFVGIEALIRRPLNPRVVTIANALGFILLLLLMAVVTYNDISVLLSR